MKIYYIEGLNPFYDEPQQSYLVDTDFGLIEFFYDSTEGTWDNGQMFENLNTYKNCWRDFQSDALMVRVA